MIMIGEIKAVTVDALATSWNRRTFEKAGGHIMAGSATGCVNTGEQISIAMAARTVIGNWRGCIVGHHLVGMIMDMTIKIVQVTGVATAAVAAVHRGVAVSPRDSAVVN